MSNQMLVDQGDDSASSPTYLPDDDYGWLGGRPVMLIRGKLSTAWVRQADSNTAACQRNGDGTLCGIYFPVTDIIGKPVVMLDANRKAVGAADYDVFGQMNHVSFDAETAHPYPLENITLADFTQPTGGTANPSTSFNIRVFYNMVDTAAVGTGYTFLTDGSSGTALTGNYGGPHAGQIWTHWVTPSAAAAGHVKAQFVSTAAGTQKGIVKEAYEYQRYQTGTTAFWTPLRFARQYYDSEANLNQNWNRFYDPSIGRYLESGPLLGRRSGYAAAMARNGWTVPAYAYALNSPIGFGDTNGREVYAADPLGAQLLALLQLAPHCAEPCNYLNASPYIYSVSGNAPFHGGVEALGAFTPGVASGKNSCNVGGNIALYNIKVQDGGFNPVENLAHELTHAVLFNYQSLAGDAPFLLQQLAPSSTDGALPPFQRTFMDSYWQGVFGSKK